MKLISLNVECGSVFIPLMEFIENHSLDTDIFCFQEVFNKGIVKRWMIEGARPDFFAELKEMLPDFNSYHMPATEGDVGGLAIFIKKYLIVNKVDSIILFPELNTTTDQNNPSYFAMGRDLLRLEFNHGEKTYTILNFHGMWLARGKIDTQRRILQSEKIKQIFDESVGTKILCTDLNVTPDTRSVNILSEGNRNLISEYEIISTRSRQKNRQEVVDYVIVSNETEVKNFIVLKDEVSNHLPLLLEFK